MRDSSALDGQRTSALAAERGSLEPEMEQIQKAEGESNPGPRGLLPEGSARLELQVAWLLTEQCSGGWPGVGSWFNPGTDRLCPCQTPGLLCFTWLNPHNSSPARDRCWCLNGADCVSFPDYWDSWLCLSVSEELNLLYLHRSSQQKWNLFQPEPRLGQTLGDDPMFVGASSSSPSFSSWPSAPPSPARDIYSLMSKVDEVKWTTSLTYLSCTWFKTFSEEIILNYLTLRFTINDNKG